MSVRWQHCIDHVDKYSKADRYTRLFLGVVPQPADSRLSETSACDQWHIDIDNTLFNLSLVGRIINENICACWIGIGQSDISRIGHRNLSGWNRICGHLIWMQRNLNQSCLEWSQNKKRTLMNSTDPAVNILFRCLEVYTSQAQQRIQMGKAQRAMWTVGVKTLKPFWFLKEICFISLWYNYLIMITIRQLSYIHNIQTRHFLKRFEARNRSTNNFRLINFLDYF